MSVTRREFAKETVAWGASLTLGLSTQTHGIQDSNAEERVRPNILWIVAEDISPLFGCYGDSDAATPHIDHFAQRSQIFTRAYTTAPICAPSRSCLATGIYATSLGTQHLRSDVEIPDQIEPLASILRRNGYWTALRGKTDYNFDPQGLFDYWKQDAAPWRARPKGKPFFAFMNLGSTHEGPANKTETAAIALKRLPPELKHEPKKITLPPYYPDTPEMRRLWARYLDLITVFDREFNDVLENLAADGLADHTIVFLMADHGMGIPRYKRWLYLTGLHVPLIIHAPPKFQHLMGEEKTSSVRNELVSYIDLPPTVLKMAGISIPERFQGQALFDGGQRDYVFGARDRADDMYDLSRAVFDGRYLYIRHFMPHLIPMQEGVIMSPYSKEFNKELYRVHEAGLDTEQSKKLWIRKSFEELYDIQNDLQELKNLAGDQNLKDMKDKLAERLRAWIVETRDTGFMPEPEMHRRAAEANATIYDISQDLKQYPLEEILSAADCASRPDSQPLPAGSDPVVTYWAIMQRIIQSDRSDQAVAFLSEQLKHAIPTVRAAAAEALARIDREKLAIPVFRELLTAEEPNLLLFTARSLAVSVDDVRPLEDEIRQTRQRLLAPPGSERPWKDFFYSAFTSWALEWALIKSGLNTPDFYSF
ncbi:MAG: sulfatase [Candidatus Omnitrophica bacterium]|nr:sulfatase [Candidatus Omnitrophota bacterium]